MIDEVKDGTSYEHKVGYKVQKLVDDGYTELTIVKNDDGWNIVAKKEGTCYWCGDPWEGHTSDASGKVELVCKECFDDGK